MDQAPSRRAELTAVDTETTSLDPMGARLVGISMAVEPGRAAYVPVGHRYAGAPDQLELAHVLKKLGPWLEDGRRAKLGQHLKYDMHVFANHGVRFAGVAHDTLLRVVRAGKPSAHDMDSLAESHIINKNN
jgi:DNA polymerase I